MNIHVYPKVLFPRTNHFRSSSTQLSQTSIFSSTMATDPQTTLEIVDKTKSDTVKEDDTLSEFSKASNTEVLFKDNLPSSLSQNSIDTQAINEYDSQTYKPQETETPTENASPFDTKGKSSTNSTTNRPEPIKKIIRSSITETEEVKEKSFKSYFDASSSGFTQTPEEISDLTKTRIPHAKYPSYSSSTSSYQYHHHVENVSKKPEDHMNNGNVTSHKVISSVTKVTPETSTIHMNDCESISRPQISVPIKVRRAPQDVRVVHSSNSSSLTRLDEFKRNCERAAKEWENIISSKDSNKLSEEVMLQRIAELESNVKEAENLLKLFSAEIREVRATADYWSKKTTNLERSYHNLHGKVKDYRANAKQSEQEYIRAMEEREYILQSLREAEVREQNLSNLLQRVEEEYSTLSRDIRILERSHAKKDRQLQNLLLEKNELSRKIKHLESHLHKLKNRSEYTYRRKNPGQTDESVGRYHSQVGDDSEYVLSDFGSLDRHPKAYTTITATEERRINNLNTNSLDDSDNYIPQKSEIFKPGGSADIMDTRKQHFSFNRLMSDSYIVPKTNESTISITRDTKNEGLLEGNSIEFSPVRHQQNEDHLLSQQQQQSNEKIADNLSDTLMDMNNSVRHDETEIENQQRDFTDTAHRKWSNASDYQYHSNHQQLQAKGVKKDVLSAEDDSMKHRSQVQVVIGPSTSNEKRQKTVRASNIHKKYAYKKVHDQPVLPSVFSGHGLRVNRHRPASVSGYLDEYGLNRPYDLYPASSSARPSTSFGQFYNTRRFKSLDRDCYTSCQNLSSKPYSTMKVIRPSNRQAVMSHSLFDRRFRDGQHSNYLRHSNRGDSEFERPRMPQSYSTHHLKIPEKVPQFNHRYKVWRYGSIL
uniref:Uncharacterized protein n=2 Tax=Trichobilharzia regenti TaxID=157069 RepID=A0AA85JQ96_TRIRE|nr:unnamed protein product [Trichobilharzia regenti]